jgi:molybdopterin converting factor subunit 1
MTVRVLLFAEARERAGTGEMVLDATEATTIAQVRTLLAARSERLAEMLPRCQMARNGEFARDDEPLRPGDELAVLPPVSGG